MRITSFQGEKIHGYLTFDIKLNDDLTFLNGINGSGKTTIVKSIVSLITPDLEWLTLTEYNKLAVIIDLEGEDVSIQSERTEKRLLLRCSKVTKPLAIPLPIFEEIEPSVRRRIQTASGRFVVRRGPARILLHGMKNDEVITAIESLPTPMFLGLERTTRRSSFFESEPEFEEPDEHPRNVFRGSLDESLKEAGAIAKDAYQDLRRQQEVLTSELRKRLILSAFRHQQEGQDFPDAIPGPTGSV